MFRLFTALLCVGCLLNANAQDSNYWTSNYGPGGFMTPGSAIADSKDSGVYFVNPALLSVRPKTALEFSASLYQYESTRIINALGQGKDLLSRQTSTSPQLHSGSFELKNNKRLVLAYALVHTHILNDRVNQRQDKKLNVLDDAYSPGAENYLGQYSEINQISELAWSVSAGYRVSQKLHVGLSLAGPVRKQSFDISYSGRALFNVPGNTDLLLPPITNSETVYRVDYTQISLQPKLGLAYNANRHHVGLLATLPIVKLYSKGTLVNDLVLTNLRLTPNSDPYNLLVSTRQTKLQTNYKTPLSMAGGYSYDYGRGNIYVSAEYFGKLGEHNVVPPRDPLFIRPDTTQSLQNLARFKDIRKAILNVGIGISFPVRPDVQGYASVRTNFSYADEKSFADEDGYASYSTNWNIYHAQFGANIIRKKSSIRPGVLLSYGTTSKYRPEVNFDTPNESNQLLGNPVDARVNHVVVGLLLSYIHNL